MLLAIFRLSLVTLSAQQAVDNVSLISVDCVLLANKTVRLFVTTFIGIQPNAPLFETSTL